MGKRDDDAFRAPGKSDGVDNERLVPVSLEVGAGQVARITIDIQIGDAASIVGKSGSSAIEKPRINAQTVKLYTRMADEEETPSPSPDDDETPSPSPDEDETPSPSPDDDETPSPSPDEDETPSPSPDAEEPIETF